MIYIGNQKVALYIGNKKIRDLYAGLDKLYSSGNMVTYKVDNSITYTEEVGEGQTCLSPTSFVPSKDQYTFVGWREDSVASNSILTEKLMGSEPITLYAVFKKDITVTTYNGSSSTTTQTKQSYYNNGNNANPTFTLSQNTMSGWTALGWCTSSSATASIAVNNGATITPSQNAIYYGKYSQTITLSYSGNGNTGGSTASQSGTRYFNSGNYSNPSFSLRSNGFSKTNYSFVNWAMGSTGGTRYNPGASVTLSNNTVFYAMWRINDYYIFKSGSGKQVPIKIDWSQPASADFNNSYIHTLSDGNTGQCLVVTESSINTANYRYLCFDMQQSLRDNNYPGHSTFGLHSNKNFDGNFSYASKSIYNNQSRQTYKIDISSLNGSYHVKFWSKHDNGAYGTHTYIYNIYLSN